MNTYKSVDEYLKALNKRLAQIGKSEKDFALIISDTHAGIVQRVFGEGKNEKEAKIGSYSTKPTLAGATSFNTKSGANKIAGSKSKRAKLKWVTVKSGGKNVSLFEVPGGYKQIRQLDGRQTSFVDLTRSGELKNDFSNSLQRQSPFVWVTGVKKGINAKKVEGLTDKYGDVFSPSLQDREKHKEKVSNLLEKIWENA